MSLRAMICDLGGVVIRIDPNRIRAHWAKRSALPRTEVDSAFPDEAYAAFERDELTEAQYLVHIRHHLRLDGTDAELADDFSQIFLGADHDSVEVLGELRGRGWKVVGLSNTNRLHERVWSRRYAEALEVFETIHCSHDLRVRKPDPAAFQSVLAHHDLSPSETVFVDDLVLNVEAARTLGLCGVVFTGADQLRRDLFDLEASSRL